MKILTLFFLTTFVLVWEESKSQTNFFKVYNSPETNEVYSSVETDDSGFILCGITEIGVGTQVLQGELRKIDSNGEVQQIATFISTNKTSFLSQIIKINDPDQPYIVIGSEDSASINYISIWHINESLESINKQSFNFGISFKNIPQESICISDSILYILSGLRRVGYPSLDLSVLKINIEGDSLSYYLPSAPGFHFPTDIVSNPVNNGIKVVYSGLSINDKGTIKLLDLDSDLNYLSVSEPDVLIHSNTGINNFNNSFILASTINHFQVNDHLFVAQGDYISNELYNLTEIQDNPDTITNTGGAKNIIYLDSIAWVVGIYNLEAGQWPWQASPSWIQLNRLDSSLELIDQHFYGGEAFYMSYDIKGTSDGGVMVVGTRYDANAIPHLYQTDPFVLKVNSEGLIVNVDNPEKPITQEAIVLPNPGNEFLQVKLAVQHKSADFQLFDINGRLVLEEFLQADMQRIATSLLKQGTYIYRITASNRVIGSGKWVKE